MASPVPELLARGADALRRGDYRAATIAYAAATEADPSLADAWFNLGWLYRAERRFEAALDAYARATAAGVVRPEEAHLNRAAILSDHLFRAGEAMAELHAALRHAPDFVPALISLGSIAEDLGHGGDARDAYLAVLRVAPGNGRARARLAALDTMAGRASDAATALKTAQPAVQDADGQADMLFALGNALDASGEYDDAWQAFEAANWIAGSIAQTRYDPAAHAGLVDRLIATFGQPPTATRADGPTPIFICGLFRSGSTLAEQILSRHSAVSSHGELEALPAIAASLSPYPEGTAGLTPMQWADLRQQYVTERGPLPDGTTAWTDKRCDNYLHIGLILSMFPEAHIVETVRQPLDNLLSAWFLRFGEGVTHAHDLAAAAHHDRQYRRLMAHWHALFPGRIHRFDYDAVVSAPRATIGALLEALDLPWEEGCLSPEAGGGAVRTASAWAVRQPLHARSSGRWRNYARHLDGLRAILDA